MPEDVEVFLDQIVAMLPVFHAVEEQLDRETGRRFSVLDLFDINEPTTSRLLAFLLNPKESHGQNDLFLRLFVERFLPEWHGIFAFDRAKLSKTKQYIDVTISDRCHWLGIENKFFSAQEQQGQCDRYLDELRERSAESVRGDYRLLYLSPSGNKPTKYSFSKEHDHRGKLVVGAWLTPPVEPDKAGGGSGPTLPVREESCADWLAECEARCKAENVRWFLLQFRALIQNRIGQKEEFNMTGAAIVDLALSSTDKLDAAIRIAGQLGPILERVASVMLNDVLCRLQQWVLESGGDWELTHEWPGGTWTQVPSKRYLPILLRRRVWPAMVGAALSADGIGPSEVFIGVMAPTQGTWDDDTNAVSFYGMRTGFADENLRGALAKALGLAAAERGWWVLAEDLQDVSDGQKISNWRTLETVKRLHANKDKVADQIEKKILDLVLKVDHAIGPVRLQQRKHQQVIG